MTHTHLTDPLNARQSEAVVAKLGNQLILAGAGSGKTRVLVHRIAWLIEQVGLSPFSILAVTFTNKAAHEMRARIESLCSFSSAGMWVGTFHSLSHRFLRKHWQAAALPEDFQIIDSDDQQRLIRRIHKQLSLDEAQWPVKKSQWYINRCKEVSRRPSDIQSSEINYVTKVLLRVYHAYEELCRNSGLLDFGELLLRSLELLRTNPDLAQHYQDRFQQILVDEFQDTNTIQYLWLRQLSGKNSHVMAVGDDDQSIYSWRGAKIENMRRFTKDYPNTQVIRLEQNYRSTQTILDAANAVIRHNRLRMDDKKLWTEGGAGRRITVYAAHNERDEAYYIVHEIQQLVAAGARYADIAILYRSNAQSRVLEERLISLQVAYRIHGGQRFFERAEIKDALAYLRLIVNVNDDAAFERVVNTPTRGIGHTTLTLLRETAREHHISLWQAAKQLPALGTASSRSLQVLDRFLCLIETIAEEIAGQTLDVATDHIIRRSGLLGEYEKDKTEKGRSRVENLAELVNATSQFKPDAEAEGLTPLQAFLVHVSLESGEEQADTHSDAVHLMSLHAAKGLEFPVVFISGMEEGLFPHKMSSEEPAGLEEERRLCYVGMTRAMKQLYLTHAESRRLHGYERHNSASRFLQEIPDECIDLVRPTAKVTKPSLHRRYQRSNYQTASTAHQKTVSSIAQVQATEVDETGLRIGQQVIHRKFGKGVLLRCEGEGEHTRVQVRFRNNVVKWLVVRYAQLEPVE